jgi:hypothetical protein
MRDNGASTERTCLLHVAGEREQVSSLALRRESSASSRLSSGFGECSFGRRSERLDPDQLALGLNIWTAASPLSCDDVAEKQRSQSPRTTPSGNQLTIIGERKTFGRSESKGFLSVG